MSYGCQTCVIDPNKWRRDSQLKGTNGHSFLRMMSRQSRLSEFFTIKNAKPPTSLSPKGSMCSVKGSQYEQKVWKVCREIGFCKRSVDCLAGSSGKADIICHFKGKPIQIEIKKSGAPDWGQASLKPMFQKTGLRQTPDPPEQNVFQWVPKNKHRNTISEILKEQMLFAGRIPPFFERKLTHKEWLQIKQSKEGQVFRDHYFNCPPDTIAQIYQGKGCSYIQISDRGLYHTGVDVCGFGVPKFECPQRIRVRIKIHGRCNASGFMSASVTAAAQPTDLADLGRSPFSLDSLGEAPHQNSFK